MLTQTCVGSSPCNPQLIWLCLFWCVSFKSRNVKKKNSRTTISKIRESKRTICTYAMNCTLFSIDRIIVDIWREKIKINQYNSYLQVCSFFLYDLESQMSGTRSKKSNLQRWTNSLRSFSKMTYSKVWCVSFLKDNSQWKFKINFWLKVLWHALIKAQPTSQKVVWPWIKIEVVFISCI